MPKTFDESLLGFSSGPKGSTKSADVNYEVDNNVIIGAFTEVLYPGEGITVRLTLPDQYFKNTGYNFGISLDFDTIYPFLVIIIFLICFQQWLQLYFQLYVAYLIVDFLKNFMMEKLKYLNYYLHCFL